MRCGIRGRTVGMMVAALVLCAACAARTPVGFAPEGTGDDASDLDAAGDTSSEIGVGDSTGPSVDSATSDSTSGQPDAAGEAMAQDTGGAAETGPGETGTPDTGAPDATEQDAASCSVGAGADYQATCAGCSISGTCLLTCTSCTTKAQTQNPNPSLQLPCPGTQSVQNTNGVLTCS
jgi:hypothetical protein